MKAKYLVTITIGEKQYEFETIIERGDRISDEELVEALAPDAQRYLESQNNDVFLGERRGFTSLNYDFLGVIEP